MSDRRVRHRREMRDKNAYLELERLIGVVEHDFAVVTTVGKMELEHDFAPESDVAPEVVPFVQTNLQRRLQSL